MRKWLLAAAAVALGVLATGAAAANGRYPAASKILFSPSDSSLAVLRTTYGVLVSHDGGETWDWLCEAALGIASNQSVDPILGLTAGGTLVAAVFDRLMLSTDTGCNWGVASCPFSTQTIADIVVRPDAPHVLLAITSTPTPTSPMAPSGAGAPCPGTGVDVGVDDSGIGNYDQVFESTDDGAHWSALGAPIDPAAAVTTLDVAPSDPRRLYVSGYRAAGGARAAVLFVSTDSGAHWVEHPMPALDPLAETEAYIASVDPLDADRVYVRTGGAGGSRLFVTSDGGNTFQIPLKLIGQMLGFALSPDGSTIYVGSLADGLLAAARASLSFASVSAVHVACLATHGVELWACSTEASGFIAGVSSDRGVSFTPKLHLRNGVRAALACPPNSSAAQCSGTAFQQFCATYGCADAGEAPGAGEAAPSDAAVSDGDAGGDAGSPAPVRPPPKPSCRCSTVGNRSTAGLVLLLAGFAGTAARRLTSPRRVAPRRGCPSR